MPVAVKSMSQVRDELLRDIKNLQPEADASVDSDYWIRATSVASAIEGLYEYQAWQTRQIFPDTADSEYLRRHAALRRMYPKPAVPAQGTARLSGTPGTQAGAGLQIVTNGMRYITMTPAIIGASGIATVVVVAMANGATSNLADNTPAQLAAAPAGVSSQVTMLTMLGGLEEETDAQLLARLLDRIRHPPAGGNAADYRSWALEVAGITDAYVFPHRSGVGSVDVAVISGNAPANDDEIQEAQLNIDVKRPAGCRSARVFTPTLKLIDYRIGVSLSGIDRDTLVASLYRDLGSYYGSLVPGALVVKSKADAIVASSVGVIDSVIDEPVGNVAMTVNAAVVEWARLGSISLHSLP